MDKMDKMDKIESPKHPVVINSFWSFVLMAILIIVGCHNMKLALLLLIIIGISSLVYLDHEVNHNENITA